MTWAKPSINIRRENHFTFFVLVEQMAPVKADNNSLRSLLLLSLVPIPPPKFVFVNVTRRKYFISRCFRRFFDRHRSFHVRNSLILSKNFWIKTLGAYDDQNYGSFNSKGVLMLYVSDTSLFYKDWVSSWPFRISFGCLSSTIISEYNKDKSTLRTCAPFNFISLIKQPQSCCNLSAIGSLRFWIYAASSTVCSHIHQKRAN